MKCFKKYSELNETVHNLQPYWSYVQCARVALGMQGQAGKYENYNPPLETDLILADFREHGVESQNFGINFKILPRFQGFTVDLNAWKRASKNTVFLHGVKKTDRIFSNLGNNNQQHNRRSISLSLM